MAHGDTQEGKWRVKMQMERVASSLALCVGTWSIQSLSADPHSLTASSRLNWHPSRFKWTRPFHWETKSGFCACAITFRTCYSFSPSHVFVIWFYPFRVIAMYSDLTIGVVHSQMTYWKDCCCSQFDLLLFMLKFVDVCLCCLTYLWFIHSTCKLLNTILVYCDFLNWG